MIITCGRAHALTDWVWNIVGIFGAWGMAAWLAGEGRMRGNSGDCKEWRRDIKRGVDYMVECKAYRGRALRIAVGIMALVLVMAGGAEATKFIRNDATGGDCTSIGDWNVATKTCTLATDLGETIQIDSDGITLNGNGNTITGSYSDIGVYLSSRTGVTIKNLNVKQFRSGISLSYSSNNTLSRNNASNNNHGIWLSDSSNNVLNGNNASDNGYGIRLDSSSNNNTLSGNNANSNKGYHGVGIDLDSSSNNTLSGNNASNNGGYNGGHGIYLSSSSHNTLSGNNASLNNLDGIV